MNWPLPDTAHVPGETPRPEISPAFEAAAAAPVSTDPDRWRENATYQYGVDLYTAGFFWEAHEVWEPIWMGASPNSQARALIAGLIQLANGCLKLSMARPGAASRLFGLSAGLLEEAGEPLMGIEPAALAREVRAFADFAPGGAAVLAQRPALVLGDRGSGDSALAPPDGLD